MRRESSTVIALVGEVNGDLLARLPRSGNISVAQARLPGGAEPDDARPGADAAAAATPGWEPGALAMREAGRRRATYVIVPDDPLAGVAAQWHAMWQVSASPQGAAAFEQSAAGALTAWRDKRFELPDYYLVIAPAKASDAGPDLYLGPLRAVRPRRVAVAGTADSPAQAASLLDALRSLEHGPWWPPLDQLLDAARHFYAGGLAETQQVLT